ncbi:ROK family transcriptional regulator [Pengzhenrongella sp.]|jgi:predicted NBD/HSP70 family sugar kinase/biotin operon repressor|uniref:ROK family transcriptional regulator n=1 Tax=Pengzhenrongella sp. TaxID=2888820 RepID=UPI002F9329D3
MTTAADRPAPRDRTREELYLLIRSGREVTRSELARVTGMSRSTVNHAVGRLLTDGRVTEVETQAKGRGSGSGRPAISLAAVASGAPVAAIDFGHSHIRVAVADALGRPLGEERLAIDVDVHAAEAMRLAAGALTRLREEHSVESLSALVAGIPGPLDRRTGMVRSPTILSSWVGLAPARELERLLDVPVHVENDALLGAYGERTCGSGRHHEDFLYVRASDGVGAGMILAGEPYKGSSGLAGEIGHTALPGRSELCRCGNRGCLEAVVSVRAIREQLAHTHPTIDPGAIDIGSFDDAIAERILNEAGRTLGSVLAHLCNLLNPSALIIGGELGCVGAPLIDGVHSSMGRYAQPATGAAIEIVPAELGVRAEITGALQLAVTLASR